MTNNETMILGTSISWDSILKRTDIAFAFGLIIVMAILIMPMPRVLMDMCLAISITFSFMILMTSLFIEKPLDFSAFPTVLLVSTMIRLSLNVATTRLILSHGHEGPQAAGKVIEAFGHFVMGGNFIIGLIVFAILVIVNFVVITKGSGRIAEVSARFSLDAMPGKQMAIDADLSAGLIDEATARKRRKELESESNFYGAMDGAAKFVRGDAVAGLLITFINIVGGVIIGVVQNNLTFLEASHFYTLLTVGDGLVTQIPALIVSMAAGLLVSKAGIEGATDKALFSQLSASPAALGMSASLIGAMGLLPGIPIFPFFLLASITGGSAWFLSKQKGTLQQQAENMESKLETNNQEGATTSPFGGTTPSSDILSSAPQIDSIRLELGYGLLTLLNQEHGQKLTDLIKHLRHQLATDLGVILPSVRLQDNIQLEPNQYVIRIKELEAGHGDLRPGQLLIMDSHAKPIQIQGEETREPSFGLPAMWIREEQRSEAIALNYTVVEPATVLSTHLSEVIKDNISDLLTYADVQKLLDNMSEAYKRLLNDMVPGQITVGGIQRILQNLVSERVSIRDLSTILEGISEATSFSRNLSIITEHVRLRLSRQITFANADDGGMLNMVSLSSTWEQQIADSLVGDTDNKQLAMAPSQIQEFINRVRQVYDKMSMLGESPILVTSALVRPFVRSILERIRPATIIMSQNEVHPKAKVKSLGQV